MAVTCVPVPMNKLLLPTILAGIAGFTLTGCDREPVGDPVAQGRHIVENVAMCVDCHTPHLPDGRLDPDRMLQGSLLPFAATVPMPWAPAAPGIAGLPTFTNDEAAVKFLMSGQTQHGTPLRPPMPSYRMSETEARAVVAFLRSLKPANG